MICEFYVYIILWWTNQISAKLYQLSRYLNISRWYLSSTILFLLKAPTLELDIMNNGRCGDWVECAWPRRWTVFQLFSAEWSSRNQRSEQQLCSVICHGAVMGPSCSDHWSSLADSNVIMISSGGGKTRVSSVTRQPAAAPQWQC